MSRQFTGRDMAFVIVGFFALVVGVNFTMAWLARDSFGGLVVDNAYVASQKYNGWLAAARTQEQLPWRAEQGLGADRHVTLALLGSPGSVTASAVAEHPLGREPDLALRFAAGADGTLRSTEALPPGRWNVRTTVNRGNETVRLAGSLQ
jgi:nitrogen fixation protein FixH